MGSRRSGAGENRVQLLPRPPVLLRNGVGVGVKRDLNVGMTKALLHHLVVTDNYPAHRLSRMPHALGVIRGTPAL